MKGTSLAAYALPAATKTISFRRGRGGASDNKSGWRLHRCFWLLFRKQPREPAGFRHGHRHGRTRISERKGPKPWRWSSCDGSRFRVWAFGLRSKLVATVSVRTKPISEQPDAKEVMGRNLVDRFDISFQTRLKTRASRGPEHVHGTAAKLQRLR